MSSYYPIEFLGIFVVFYVTYKLKLQKYIISFLFKDQVVYLPLTDDDFNQLMKLKQEYKDNKKETKVLIRSCQFTEYSEKSQSAKYLDFDFLIFLYLCNFVITLGNVIYQILRLAILGKEKSPFLINEKGNNNTTPTIENLNFNLYLTISFIIYIIYRELKKYIFSHGFTSKAAIRFYICFLLSFCLFYLNEFFNEKLFNLNYDSACTIFNNRVDLILSQAKADFSFNIEKKHMKIIFSIIFGLISGIFLRATERGAYFDNFFCNFYKPFDSSLANLRSYQSEGDQKKNHSALEYIAKIKSITNLIITVIFLEPLLDHFLEVININALLNKIIIIFLALLTDFILGFYILWYAYFIFSVQNYQEIMKFVKNPNSKYLNSHKSLVNYINENAWDICSHVFMNSFLPFYLFLVYSNQINIFSNISKIKENNSAFNNGFIDNILFIIFLALVFSKGIIENAIFYYRLIIKEKHLKIF